MGKCSRDLCYFSKGGYQNFDLLWKILQLMKNWSKKYLKFFSINFLINYERQFLEEIEEEFPEESSSFKRLLVMKFFFFIIIFIFTLIHSNWEFFWFLEQRKRSDKKKNCPQFKYTFCNWSGISWRRSFNDCLSTHSHRSWSNSFYLNFFSS